MRFINTIQPTHRSIILSLEQLQPFVALALRIWIAQIFFMSGLTKIQSWDTTLMLFEYEYAVPLIAPVTAAWLATIGELLLAPMLVLGLCARFSIVGLFVLNVIAAISYPDISPAGDKDHLMWGIVMIVLLTYGPGKFSIDHYLFRNK